MTETNNELIEDLVESTELGANDLPEQAEETQFQSPEHLEAEGELLALKAELEELRAELKARDELEKANSKLYAEIEEFKEYFPETELHEIPDEVWKKVKKGASLSATFSLYHRRQELDRRKVNDFNEKNRRMSSGSINHSEGDKYFSPSEVKKMTPLQVKQNYDDIINSMRHWN